MDSIGWFARNSVAANLIMALIVIGGLVSLLGIPVDKIAGFFGQDLPVGAEGMRKSAIKQEVFPEFSLDIITVSVDHISAGPRLARAIPASSRSRSVARDAGAHTLIGARMASCILLSVSRSPSRMG